MEENYDEKDDSEIHEINEYDYATDDEEETSGNCSDDSEE